MARIARNLLGPLLVALLAVLAASPGVAHAAATSSWVRVSGGGSTPDALAGASSATAIHLFHRGNDNKIYVSTRSHGLWTGWSEVPGGGLTPSAPAVALEDVGLLHVFVRGTDDRVYWNPSEVVNDVPVNFGSWLEVPGGGRTRDALAAVASAEGVHVVARSTTNRVFMNTFAHGHRNLDRLAADPGRCADAERTGHHVRRS